MAASRPSHGPTRRAFLRTGLAAGVATSTAGLASSSLALLWPDLHGTFGGEIAIGALVDVRTQVLDAGGPLAITDARCYLLAYDPADDPDGLYAEVTGGTGLMALHHRCVHLGCRVPWCASSGWFECPCHRSRYDRWGEWVDGPAARGLDRFPLHIDDDVVVVDTSVIVTGPGRGHGVLGESADGPSCLG